MKTKDKSRDLLDCLPDIQRLYRSKMILAVVFIYTIIFIVGFGGNVSEAAVNSNDKPAISSKTKSQPQNQGQTPSKSAANDQQVKEQAETLSENKEKVSILKIFLPRFSKWWGQVYPWRLAAFLFIVAAIYTLKPRRTKSEINPVNTPDPFSKSIYFSEKSKKKLQQHYSRFYEILSYWKRQEEKYKHFHYYCLYWSIPSSILVPIISQVKGDDARLFLTVISTHTAILLAFHKGFKVDKNYKTFRHGVLEFNDTLRRLLDRPSSFDDNSNSQQRLIENYFEAVERITKYVRIAETGNLPNVEEKKTQNNSETGSPASGDGRNSNNNQDAGISTNE